MEKEIQMEILGLMLGNSEAQFVSRCVNILRKYHCKRVASHYVKMETHKAAQRLQKLVEPEPALA